MLTYIGAALIYIVGWCWLQLPYFWLVKLVPPLLLFAKHQERRDFLFWCWFGDLLLLFSTGIDLDLIMGLAAFTVAHIVYQNPSTEPFFQKNNVRVITLMLCPIVIISDPTRLLLALLVEVYLVIVTNGIVIAESRDQALGYACLLVSDLLILATLLRSLEATAMLNTCVIGLYWIGLWWVVPTKGMPFPVLRPTN